ncbi:MAG: HEAT repeat domain-containing protein [Thermodesulfobacteriota bacterium]|nr:HEAT repeat domain-containing protein [Thermodesulfobacteriota bacterium]
MGGRQLKKKVFDLLHNTDFEKDILNISGFSARAVVNPLFSFFYNSDELIKWRAVTAMGVVVQDLADHDLESARVVMRRLLWNLNDESGGIGWGSPEAMGEITARHEGLAKEYHHILLSYIVPDANYIEHEILQRGVLWGIGRLAHARSHFVKNSIHLLCPYLKSPDPALRGLAAWTAGLFDCQATDRFLKRLESDPATFTFYLEGTLETLTVAQLFKKSFNPANKLPGTSHLRNLCLDVSTRLKRR